MKLALLSCVLLAAACSPYAPDLPPHPFLCGSGGACPDGYTCTTAGAQQVCSSATGSASPDAGSGAIDAAIDAAPDAPQSTCVHDICTVGVSLTASCDPCVTQICAADDFCCTTKWSAQCVSEVSSICHQSTCP